MGLLDSVLGGLARGSSGNAIFESVLSMVNDPAHGGLQGLVQVFRDQGLGALADSWVSTGHNLPLSAGQLEQALGSGRLGDLASQLGLSTSDLSSKLTELLPHVVDQLTPHGKLPDAGSLESLLGALKSRIG